MAKTEQQSPERQLAEQAARDLARRERKTAKALLKTERRTLDDVSKTIDQLTQMVAASPTPSTVRRATPAAHAALGMDLLRGREDARGAGRRRLEEDFEELRFPLTVTSSELDAAAAFVAASGLTAAWGAASLQAIAAGSSIRKVAKVVEPNVERTVATEVARAFNDERERLLVDLGAHWDDHHDGGLGFGGVDDIPKAGAFKLWSAVLDSRTCPTCFKADGEIVELHKSFTAGVPPIHPRCRCVTEHVLVHKPERLEDIAIDYDLFKSEMRDIIREGRAESERHSLGFASDSLGSKRSPLALTKRFSNERYTIRR